jgi:hypothetical protein
VGDIPTISYVGIRGDEDRDGYISHKPTIQAIFPFRENIWSMEIIRKTFSNENIPMIKEIGLDVLPKKTMDAMLRIIETPISFTYYQNRKVKDLLSIGIKGFNKIVFTFLKNENLPVSMLEDFPLIENEDILVREDIFNILEKSGVGVPGYYKKVEFEVDGKKGHYARSRSGCYFCFFQQKIEWIWLYENHPDKFEAAMAYEKDGYTWMQDEGLSDLIKPERMKKIKLEQLKKIKRSKDQKSPFLVDILQEAEGEGCAACFL